MRGRNFAEGKKGKEKKKEEKRKRKKKHSERGSSGNCYRQGIQREESHGAFFSCDFFLPYLDTQVTSLSLHAQERCIASLLHLTCVKEGKKGKRERQKDTKYLR